MTPEEKQQAMKRYAERLRRLGPGAEALGWRDRAQQELRFQILASGAQPLAGKSVLDIGCGFGDLYHYLSAGGVDVRYTGCDISPEILAVARERHPGLTVEERDVLEDPYPDEAFDYVFLSGIFNRRLSDNEGFLERLLACAYRTCAVAVCANMTTDQVDYRDDHLYYFNPEGVVRFCRSLSRFVALRHDYPLFEFTVFIYQNANRG